MKKYLLITLAALMAFCSCDKQPKEDPEETKDPVVKIEITNIADNKATVNATMEQGKFYGGKILAAKKVSNIDIDYTKEIALINYVKENGTDITEMPASVTVEKLTVDKDYFSAVVVYDKDGRVCSSAYETWTAQGSPDGIAEGSTPGSLGDNELK